MRLLTNVKSSTISSKLVHFFIEIWYNLIFLNGSTLQSDISERQSAALDVRLLMQENYKNEINKKVIMDVENERDKLQFKEGNPGAVQYGNFINYYQFHSPHERIKLLPKHIWEVEKPCVALDIGCNAGKLTFAINEFLKENVRQDTSTLAVDIDPLLIARAKETRTSDIKFHCLDIMDENRRKVIKNYLKTKNVQKFAVVFCFSTTMWIHLNHGDNGLKTFLEYIAGIGEVVIIEPQPWKCYKSAVKRMKQANFVFPLFASLQIRENIENEIEIILTRLNMEKVTESERTQWERKLLIYKNSLK